VLRLAVDSESQHASYKKVSGGKWKTENRTHSATAGSMSTVAGEGVLGRGPLSVGIVEGPPPPGSVNAPPNPSLRLEKAGGGRLGLPIVFELGP